MGVGISVLIALKATMLFLSFVYLRNLGFMLLSFPFLYASLISFLLSLASHPSINLPLLLGKTTDGRFPIWSLIMFSPYLYFVRLFSTLRRLRSREAPYSEIHDGLYVGGWPSSREKLPPGDPCVIDCTCELPRMSEFSGLAYMCVPTWDTRSPQPAEIENAVKWAIRKRELQKPVFIHCAYGKLLKFNGKVVALFLHEVLFRFIVSYGCCDLLMCLTFNGCGSQFSFVGEFETIHSESNVLWVLFLAYGLD